jgi:hypothetical protein
MDRQTIHCKPRSIVEIKVLPIRKYEFSVIGYKISCVQLPMNGDNTPLL